MIKLKIPVQNTVEFIIGDIFIECRIRFREQYPAQSTEGKIVLEQFKDNLSILAAEFANEISSKVEEQFKESDETQN